MKRLCLRTGSDLPAVEFIFIAGGDAEKVVAVAASSESSSSSAHSSSISETEAQAWSFGRRMSGESSFDVVNGDFSCSVSVDAIHPLPEGPCLVVPEQYRPEGIPTILWQ
jgi:hypothetical protein